MSKKDERLHHGRNLGKALDIIENPMSTELELKRAELHIEVAREIRSWYSNYTDHNDD